MPPKCTYNPAQILPLSVWSLSTCLHSVNTLGVWILDIVRSMETLGPIQTRYSLGRSFELIMNSAISLPFHSTVSYHLMNLARHFMCFSVPKIIIQPLV